MSIVSTVVRRASSIAQALLVVLSSAAVVHAQTGRITGLVSDSAAAFPVTGVNITVIGTTLGAVSGDNGRYTITAVPAGTYTLEARRLGYAP